MLLGVVDATQMENGRPSHPARRGSGFGRALATVGASLRSAWGADAPRNEIARLWVDVGDAGETYRKISQ